MIIYVDLDETLIHTESHWKSNTRDLQFAITTNVSTGEYRYFSQKDFKEANFIQMKALHEDHYMVRRWRKDGAEYYVNKFRTKLRPEAKEFLTELRNLGYDVQMLTKASFGYAKILNDLFEFGFETIIAKEHWYGLAAITPTDKNILIDNLRFSDNEKMRWLGKTNIGYIKVPDFYGAKYEQKIVAQNIIDLIKIYIARNEKGV